MSAISPVVLIQPDDRGRIDSDWLAAHAGSFRQASGDKVLLSRPPLGPAPADLGVAVLECGSNTGLVGQLKALTSQHDGMDVVLIQSGIQLPDQAIPRLIVNTPADGLTSCLSSTDPRLNPLAAWVDDTPDLEQANERLQRLQPLAWLPLSHWPAHLLYIPASVQARILQSGLNAEQLLADGSLDISARTDLLVTAHDAGDAQPGGSDVPNAAAQLGMMMKAASEPDDGFRGHAAPVSATTLHVTHAWGGGVGRWVRDFCSADDQSRHYTLVASGHPDSGWGSRLALHRGDDTGPVVAEWQLPTPIRTVAQHHTDYSDILKQIIRDRSIGRIIVSSLVGHSLDVLATGLPTLQVLHDFFPAWPLLESSPPVGADHSDEGSALAALNRALAEQSSGEKLQGRSARGWLSLRNR